MTSTAYNETIAPLDAAAMAAAHRGTSAWNAEKTEYAYDARGSVVQELAYNK